MNKLITILIMMLLSLALVACNVPVSAQLLKSDKQRNMAPQISPADLQTLVAGNDAFAWNLYQQIKGENGNLFFSPYSLSLALAMAYAGANGDTQKQMAQTLHFDLPPESLNTAFNYLALELAKRATIPGRTLKGKDAQGFSLNVVNDLWGQKDYKFLNSFLDTLSQNYGAGLRIVDYVKDPEGARQIINQYISDQTNGKIKDLIQQGVIDQAVRLVLTNAIYFNAAWANPFDAKNTSNGNFNTLNGSRVNVPMMKLVEALSYAKGDNYQAIELPYDGNQLSMVVIMPDAGQFTSFEQTLDAQKVVDIVTVLSPYSVTLSMPSFQFDASFDLGGILAAMGMPLAFSDSADFSGMTGKRDLEISDVVHKAYVSVNEAGTEAAAASAAIMRVTGILTRQAQMTIDHPFIFLIRDIPTGTIIFAGRVVNPAA